MTWFLDRQEAEALLATIVKHPDYTYAVTFGGCGPSAYGVAVHDPDGVLVTEAYSPGDIIPLRAPPRRVGETRYRRLQAVARRLKARRR